MDHCRGFIRGIVRGCLLGPVAGIVFVIVLASLDRESFQGEFGPIPALIGWAFGGVPVGAIAGAFFGAIHDALRVNDFERWFVVVCMLPILLGLVVIPVVVSIW